MTRLTKPRRVGRPMLLLPEATIIRLWNSGMGYFAIASRVSEQIDYSVSHMTIKRRLQKLGKVPGSK